MLRKNTVNLAVTNAGYSLRRCHSASPSAISVTTSDFIGYRYLLSSPHCRCVVKGERWERTRGRVGPGAYGSVR